MTPNIMYADRLHYRQGLERILEYINKDMENETFIPFAKMPEKSVICTLL